MSLRWRFAVALSGAVLACTAVCIAAAVLFLSQALTDRSTSDLRQTLNGVSGYMDNQRHDLLGIAELVASDPGVRASVATGNQQALVVHLTPMYADLNADIMDVIDAKGRVLTRMEDTLVSGDMVGNRPSIRRALAGREVTALESDLPSREAADGYALRAVVPIRRGPKIIGAVVVGRQLGTIFAERIGRALNANVNLIAGNQRTGTTLEDSNGLPVTGVPEPSSVLRRISTGKTSIAMTEEKGGAVLSGLVPLQSSAGRWVGAIEVVRPLNPLYDLIRGLSLLLLVLGIVVVVLGTVLALNISRRLTSRLSVLDAAASRIAGLAKGNEPLGELHLVTSVAGSDEIASLAGSFSSMMKALDERMATNAELYAASQARVRELSGLAEIARLLTAVSSVQATLDVLSEQVCRVVGAEAVAIWLPREGARPALQGGFGLPASYEALSNSMLEESAKLGAETAAQTVLRTGQVEHRDLRNERAAQHSSQAELLAHMQSLGWAWAVAVPLRIQSRILGAMTCYTRAERSLTGTDLSLLTTIADQVAVAVENARLAAEAQTRAALEERLQAQEELERRVEERTRELSTLLDVSRNVASMLDLEPLLGLVLDQLRAVVESDGASILTLQGDELIVLARRAPETVTLPFPERYSLAAHRVIWDVLHHGKPVIIDDVHGDSPLARAYQDLTGEYMNRALSYERAIMIIPMLLQDRITGLVNLSSSRPGYYTMHHAALTQAIAQQAAIAIENARLYEQAQEVAVLEERQRLARELHDSVSQALYGVALGARTARTLLDRDPVKVAEPLEYVLAQAEAGLTEMRTLIFELRPQALESEGLVAALRKQVEAVQVRHGLAIRISLGDEPDVPFAVKEAVYRIAQESLHNTVKHARARSIAIRMHEDDKGITLDVHDDGRGFDPAGSFPGHLGLRTMRERALRLGGILLINSAPGRGTSVHVRIPVMTQRRDSRAAMSLPVD